MRSLGQQITAPLKEPYMESHTALQDMLRLVQMLEERVPYIQLAPRAQHGRAAHIWRA